MLPRNTVKNWLTRCFSRTTSEDNVSRAARTERLYDSRPRSRRFTTLLIVLVF